MYYDIGNEMNTGYMDISAVQQTCKRAASSETGVCPDRKDIQQKNVMTLIVLLASLITFLSLPGSGSAAVYKYQDEKGNWHFTDSPPADQETMEEVKGLKEKKRLPVQHRDILKALTEKFSPKNGIERASLATVSIRSLVGTGSGFFISPDGLILTNKHVLRGDESKIKRTKKDIADTDEDIRVAEEKFAVERAKLKEWSDDLEKYKKTTRRSRQRSDYEKELGQYKVFEKDFKRRLREFEDNKQAYETKKMDFHYRSRMAGLDTKFQVILKDKTELEADLVAISDDLDLALLRIHNTTTPQLQPTGTPQLVQGMKVFAIGSPGDLKDWVSSGVVSGYDADFIRTDARIYPGNSGGPLVTEDGIVIGVNTLKMITRKFEGIGFAIPFNQAVSEFRQYLK